MYGAILGDIIGSPYEFDRGNKTKDFPLFCRRSCYTDDSVMTIAVAEALMDSKGKNEEETKTALVASMQKWGAMEPDAGYGNMFYRWLRTENPQPYGSYGNGSAMRVSSAGWLYDTLEETREKARWTAEVTHNHPEGVKGAEATASAIFLARTGRTKDEIRNYITETFGYDLSRTCDEIRPNYRHVESCQETVPEAITAFLEGENFTDVIRTAVSLGGDCDTLTCIAGSIAEAYHGIPEWMKYESKKRISPEMKEVLIRFDEQKSKYHISDRCEDLKKLKVSDDLRNTDPERAEVLKEYLYTARNYPGLREKHDEAMHFLRKAFIDGEICPKTDRENEMDNYRDDTPAYFRGWFKGEKATKIFLDMGIITEEDLQDPPEE